MSEHAWHPWKMTAIGLGLAVGVALVTGVVVANWTGRDVAAAAQTSQSSKTVEIVKDGAIGAVVGAGGGVLYSINENRTSDARYRDVYAGCMRTRGYAG